MPYVGGALLGAYGPRSPCVRTLHPAVEEIVLRAVRSHGSGSSGAEGDVNSIRCVFALLEGLDCLI